uniref:Uncharacterized protein n=1 Tax=Pseudobryopsis hainanensis TaxID=2320808 RepID=A0A3S7SY56_9CHLO|nr:hypothetical protein [Pseudobryopsis hainanensis]
MRIKVFGNSVGFTRTKRPLNHRRERGTKTIYFFKLPVWFDLTNRSTRWVRSRIRWALLPFLQRCFCPSLSHRLQTFLISEFIDENNKNANWLNWTAYYLVQAPPKHRFNQLIQFLKCLNIQTNFFDLYQVYLVLLKLVK